MEPEPKRALRLRLAQLLGRSLERLASDASLVEVARDPRRLQAALGRLQKELGISVDPKALVGARTVDRLVTVLAESVRAAAPPAPPDQAVEAPAAPPPPREAQGEVYASPLAHEAERIRAAAVYCSDGRMGDPFDDFLHAGLGLPRYDRLACPGGPVALAGRLAGFWECRSVEPQLRFLLSVHGVKQVVLIAHQPCAYYLEHLRIPPDRLEAEQVGDLQQAAGAVRRLDATVEVGAFIAWVEEGRVHFEKVLATEALAGRWRSRKS